MPLTPNDTSETEILAGARSFVGDNPVLASIIALLLGFILGSQL